MHCTRCTSARRPGLGLRTRTVVGSMMLDQRVGWPDTIGGNGLRGVDALEPSSERGVGVECALCTLTLVKAERGEPIDTSERDVTSALGLADTGRSRPA
mmetsp:Transcript_19728/g.50962  ORF Transcript_19728/g.50962 Transcript_19728/m.50962 type:complete len:99 (+) Transcript_19728:223-519(+)